MERRPKYAKCSICDKRFADKGRLIDHIEKVHQSSIPEGWSAAQYECFLRTGKSKGTCIYCKKETSWNPATGKYNRMCGSPECKKKAYELAQKNYIGKHGHVYSINNPEVQKKMVYGRKNSGKYIFIDEKTGQKYEALYDSSYGKDFFEMLDTLLGWNGADIIAPSPHTYYYEYEGTEHFYIPDAYSTSLNLEIELKDGGDNPNLHPKIQAVDKVKEKLKDELMASLAGQVNYIKICNKDYREFFALLSRLKAEDSCPLPKWEGKLEPSLESTEEDIAPDDYQITEATDPIIQKVNFIKRGLLVYDPRLNYDDLLNYYRKQLFHGKLNKSQWMELYSELECVRNYLKAVVNNREAEDTERLKYSAKEALTEINNFIQYMDENPPIEKRNISVRESQEAPVSESSWESHILPDFQPKGHKDLSDFKLIKFKVGDEIYLKYKPVVYRFEWLDRNTDEAYLWVTNNEEAKYVALIAIEMADHDELGDNRRLIKVLDVSEEFRGYGLGTQLINYAVKKLKADALGVEKDNEIAIRMYQKYGFRIAKRSLSEEYYRMYLGMIPGDEAILLESQKDPNRPVIHKPNMDDYGEGMKPHRVPQEMVESKVILETLLQSTLDPNFKPKGDIKLSSLKRIENPDQTTFDKYAKRLPVPSIPFTDGPKNDSNSKYQKYFAKLNDGEKDAERFRGNYIWYTKWKDKYNMNFIFWVDSHDDLVAFVIIYKKNGISDLQAFFISKQFRGYGLGNQILQYLISTYQIKMLGVAKDNEVARNLYEKFGFRITSDSEERVKSGRAVVYSMIRESSNFHDHNNYAGAVTLEKATATHTPNYFYHLVPKGIAESDQCITSLEYQYRHDKNAFHRNSEKYRERLCNGWGVYPGRNPSSLTDKEVHDGICRFRHTNQGCNQIYLFKFPPYLSLGKKMAEILREKDIYRIDLNDPVVRKLLISIDWGWNGSSTDNEKLTSEYYDNISPKDYFAKYTETGNGLLFATLNHISISPRIGYIPIQYWTKIETPIKIEDIMIEGYILNQEDIRYNLENWKPGKDTNILLVTGLSGSGKTTIGYEMAYNFKAELFQLDWADNPSNMKNSPSTPNYGLWQYVKDKCKKHLSDEDYREEHWHDMVLEVFEAIRSFARMHIDKLFIVEGIQIVGHLHDYPNIEKFPIVIKGTSALVSLYRRFQRDTLKDAFRTGDSNILKWYHDQEKYLQMFREQVVSESFIQGIKEEGAYYPVFIVLSYTGTVFAKLVKFVTKDPYAHASISFDTNMDKMLSFNADGFGMVIENIKNFFTKKTKDAKYSIYMYLASASEYDLMRRFCDGLLSKIGKLKYNLLGLTNFLFGRGSEKEDQFFCSEFVAAVLKAGNEKILQQPTYLTLPYTLAKNKNLIFIKRGLFRNYKSSEIDKIVSDKLKERGYNDVRVQ